MTSKNFNESHPELKEGEVLLKNVKLEDNNPVKELCRAPDSARLGNRAYTDEGLPLEDWLPIFVNVSDLETLPSETLPAQQLQPLRKAWA